MQPTVTGGTVTAGKPGRGGCQPYADRMEFDEVIRKRRMVRAFTSEPVDPGAEHRLLAAANRAPSAGFSQGYALLVFDEPDQLGPFWELLAAYHGAAEAAGPAFDPVIRAFPTGISTPAFARR
jgi:nitroreductase